MRAADIEKKWANGTVLHYHLAAGLVVRPPELAAGHEPQPGLSPIDIEEAQRFYPSMNAARERSLRPFESQRLLVGPSEQVDFRIRPERTRRYTLQTFGIADTVMVLFEDVDGTPVYVDGDDDSGWERNARIEERLYRGREYVLRVRLYYAEASGETAVFMY